MITSSLLSSNIQDVVNNECFSILLFLSKDLSSDFNQIAVKITLVVVLENLNEMNSIRTSPRKYD